MRLLAYQVMWRNTTCVERILVSQRRSPLGGLPQRRVLVRLSLGRQALPGYCCFQGDALSLWGFPSYTVQRCMLVAERESHLAAPGGNRKKGGLEPVLCLVVVQALCQVWGCPLVFC